MSVVAPSAEVRRGTGVAKRAFDLVFAVPMAIVTFPLVAIAAVGVYLSDPGPVIYRAKRCGLHGKPFTLYKLRSMRRPKPDQEVSRITAGKVDNRVFPFGKLIRAIKVDELPQFWNVVRGEIAVVGPRPEDPHIVEQHYMPFDLETLNIPPGLTSPGSLFTSTHGDDLLSEEDSERDYIERVLPLRLALEHVYMGKQSVVYDIWVVWRTVGLICGTMIRKSTWKEQPEVEEAKLLLPTRTQRKEA